jgi:hypothetical protein
VSGSIPGHRQSSLPRQELLPPSQISTVFTVPVMVVPGTMNERITNPDGQYTTLMEGYILT